jgi:hypothetical protein
VIWSQNIDTNTGDNHIFPETKELKTLFENKTYFIGCFCCSLCSECKIHQRKQVKLSLPVRSHYEGKRKKLI